MNSPDPLELARSEVDVLIDMISTEYDVDVDRASIDVGLARWKSQNGVCKHDQTLDSRRSGKKVYTSKRKGHCSIVINERILEDGGTKTDYIDTVRHEVAHVVDYLDSSTAGGRRSSSGHGPEWKMWAKRLGADPSSCHTKKEDEYKYYVACPNGCARWGRHKRSKTVKHPGRYHCKECKENLVAYEAGEEPPSEPGVSTVT